jgi:hypothetical protein
VAGQDAPGDSSPRDLITQIITERNTGSGDLPA